LTVGLRNNRNPAREPSKFETNACAHHGLIGVVDVRIKIDLPKPFRPIVINADPNGANILARIQVSGLENSIEGDAVVPIYLMPLDEVGVLLAGVQPYIKNGEGLNAIIAAELVAHAERH